ncbi:thioredoxin family protein [Flavobacteriaceae bacterium]|nr:thioredoxin family protein [Flavobacteriaceae bacterium]MDC1522762.1 thioredoxin family protein [Flavobacteriaceae bacterium]
MKKYALITILFVLMMNTAGLFAQEWRSDWDTAKVEAEQPNKKLILVFSGSDWCIPCIKLEKEIWKSPAFIQYAQKHYVLFRADFPKRKKNKLPETIQQLNDRLASEYNPKGYFPLVVVLDSVGEIKGQLGYEKVTPEAYIALIEQL